MLLCAAPDWGVGGVGVARFFSSMQPQSDESAIKVVPQRCANFICIALGLRTGRLICARETACPQAEFSLEVPAHYNPAIRSITTSSPRSHSSLLMLIG